MRTLLLAAVASFAAPSVAQLPYDLQFPAGVAVDVVSWNGQPALLMWGRQPVVCSFAGEGIYQRVVLDAQLTMFVDSRNCAVGSSVGFNANAYGHLPLGRMPVGGVLFTSSPHQLRDMHQQHRMTQTTYVADYCPTSFCDGCVPRGQFDAPELWAVICTVRLQ